jgi:serine/threonine protein kinase/Tol biopolymer transport system component
MAIETGTRFGPYEILGPLGAGGMGQVYRARDTRLDRIVALKIISPDVAHHALRQQRFRREAIAISSLSHPHICALYDVGEQDGVAFLVMEHLEGTTVAARLLRGPLPLDEALHHATEVAGALDHAHRQGVVHRDLKPSNVMLTAAGAKLLDFGLAKLRQAGADAGLLPGTESIPGAAATAEGTILGTVQYMAPEQLEGKEADARTDVFAFGTLVYEMVTGQKAFTGTSQASLIAAILRADAPRISALKPLAPPALDHIVARCLAKDPDERWQTARDLMLELREIEHRGSSDAARAGVKAAEHTVAGGSHPQSGERPRLSRERVAWAVSVAATLLAVTMGTLYWRSPGTTTVTRSDSPVSAAVRSEIPAPDGTNVGSTSLSPDGRRLVFVGRRGLVSRLWVRPLDSVTASPLAGTDGADYPFWSPDGQSLAFFADGKLKRIEVSGGPVQTLADAPNTRGGAWSSTGTIVFSPNSQTLHRVSATGGPSEEVTALDTSRGEISHRWPCFLPDGQHFLYLAQSSVAENRGIFVGSLDRSTKKFVVRTEDSGAYVSPGYLLFLRETTLVAQRFRTDRLEVEGSPVPLAEPVGVNGLERAQFDVSTGALVYRRGAFLGSSEVAWVDRTGRRIGTIGSAADFRAVRISPGGHHIAIAIEDQRVGTPDIWVHDVSRNLSTRFTFDLATDRDPVWSPDGGRLAVRSNRNDRSTIYVRAINGVGGEKLLLESSHNASIHDWSRDGGSALFTQSDPAGQTDRDIWILPLQAERAPYPFIRASFNQDYPRFSPSGRLVSYQTDDSGRNKVYVVPFPDTGDKWEISPAGGVQPIWRADGRELFYVAPDNTIMAVDVREGPATIEFGTPRPLFQAAIAVLPARQPSWTWDVAADGQQFLLILAKDDPAPLTLVTNWRADLREPVD